MIVNSTNSDDSQEALGARLALVRAESGLTQMAFAQTIGLSARAYHYYERGLRKMPIDAIDRLAATYDVDLNWLIRGFGQSAITDMDAEIEAFALGLFEYLEVSRAKVRPKKSAAIVSRWYKFIREGKAVSAEDVQVWVDFVRTDE